MQSQRARVMVIDDEKVVGDMLRIHLTKRGYQVETFLSAASALLRLEQEPFDLIVTDFKMKGMDGMELLKTVKERYPDIQVIMITAFAHLDTAIEAFRGQVHDFFPKPFKIKDLLESIERALGQGNQPRTEVGQ
ncbi:response regulator [Desulfovibrio sp. TomC]|uniref:response regulator n=1 Tax=Desulfovibrio sp. TomC TaxID=1562888 RepID=UPI0005BBF524|nr:response regulator [Desulfovibrio sp. TomC]